MSIDGQTKELEAKNVKKWPRGSNFLHILPKTEHKMWPDDKKLLI